MDWQNSSSLQLVLNDLNEIAADAYRHRIRTRAKKGGNGVYDASNGGFVYLLPRRFELNKRARFEVVRILPNAIVVKAVSLEGADCYMQAVVDGRGQLTNLEFPSSQARPSITMPDERQRLPLPRPLPVNAVRAHHARPAKVYEDF